MKKFYIASAPKAWIKEFFEDGSWTWEKMTSVLVERDNGKVIQIFGSCSSYGEIGDKIELVSDRTCRTIGYGKIIGYADEITRGVSTTYVFK